MSDAIEGAERQRLAETDRGERAWRRWGAYLSERQLKLAADQPHASVKEW